MKRIFSMVLCISILFTTIIQGTLYASAASYDESSYTLTGNQRADIVGIALTQIGYTESGDNITKYGSWYGNNTAWCDIFVYWCADKAGISTSIIPRFGGTYNGESWFKSQGLWQSASYTPNQGDLVFFSWGHVGIVESAASDGSIYIIDGNFSDKVNYRRIYSGGGKWYGKEYIDGYGTPNYQGSSTIDPVEPIEPPADVVEDFEEVDTYYRVTTQTDPLNLRADHTTASSIVGSIPKDAVFYVSKTIASGGYTWGMTDYSGTDAWCALKYATAITASDVTLTSDKQDITIKSEESETLSCSISPSDIAGYGVKWSSSDDSVAAVSENGIVAGGAPGNAVITATSVVGGATLTYNITVKPNVIETGDLDHDGKISVSDIVILRAYILSGTELDQQIISEADINNDGILSVSDVVALRSIIMS